MSGIKSLNLKVMTIGTIIAIILIVFLLWPQITRWITRLMMRSWERKLRKMAGQFGGATPPPNDGKRHGGRRRKGDTPPPQPRPKQHPARMMKEVAEDVQYTEVREYSQTTIHTESDDTSTTYTETQVEDVKFTEIKDK